MNVGIAIGLYTGVYYRFRHHRLAIRRNNAGRTFETFKLQHSPNWFFICTSLLLFVGKWHLVLNCYTRRPLSSSFETGLRLLLRLAFIECVQFCKRGSSRYNYTKQFLLIRHMLTADIISIFTIFFVLWWNNGLSACEVIVCVLILLSPAALW